ncbi:hypothetical protein EVAR_92097_1 [Eumeta japonica]|uniref:Uncharacterized protein n=1 Tax=Eumeta variegata TaxID=151549 RepID=A0A4C1SZ14_EUMVA|nr:hypothetical protein EVAR_92097_1 [Eumeta japonica]
MIALPRGSDWRRRNTEPNKHSRTPNVATIVVAIFANGKGGFVSGRIARVGNLNETDLFAPRSGRRRRRTGDPFATWHSLFSRYETKQIKNGDNYYNSPHLLYNTVELNNLQTRSDNNRIGAASSATRLEWIRTTFAHSSARAAVAGADKALIRNLISYYSLLPAAFPLPESGENSLEPAGAEDRGGSWNRIVPPGGAADVSRMTAGPITNSPVVGGATAARNFI